MPLEGEQLAIEETQVAQEELTAFVEQMNASGEEVEELKGALAEAEQDVNTLRDELEEVQREFDALRSEGSCGVSRISETSGRCVTLMRSNGDWTMTGALQALKETPETRTTYSPALYQTYTEALDFLTEQTEADGENNLRDRMVKAPLRQDDLLNALRDVEKIVVRFPKFTLTSGEKPEHTMEYILGVLGLMQTLCVALMDTIWSGKDSGGSSVKATKTYFGIRNCARDADTT